MPESSSSVEELLVVVAELKAVNAELRAVNARLREVVASQADRIAELERRAGRDSGTSSKPPSSDSPFTKKKATDRSLRGKSGRSPGKQPGAQSSTLKLVDDPDHTVACVPQACVGCGCGLGEAPVTGMSRRQVFDIGEPPPPVVTEYQVQARTCGCCGTITQGQAPDGVSGRAQYGPQAHAQAVNLVCGHHIPIHRSTLILAALAGLRVSTGWMAGVRAKAAARLEPFMTCVRELLARSGALHVDETPARAAGGMEYVHVACTRYLAHLHTGGRSASDIDAGGVLPGYAGTIVRDGYAGYAHLTDALHAWCGAHLLRDLADLHRNDPDGQRWARSMADLLIWANNAAAKARASGHTTLDETTLKQIQTWYAGAIATADHDNQRKQTQLAKDARRLARRFTEHQDMILRFATDLTIDFTNNEAERQIRPVKVQMRTSGGCWRTLQGLADFAIVQSYLTTATKWGIDRTEALRQLFTTGAWLPPGLTPAE